MRIACLRAARLKEFHAMENDTRRVGDRVSYMHEVTVDYEGTKLTLSGLDISPSGMGLWGPTNCPAGVFELTLPLDDAMDPIVTRARVVRQFHSDGGSVWGVTFEGLADAARQRLERYIERQRAAA